MQRINNRERIYCVRGKYMTYVVTIYCSEGKIMTEVVKIYLMGERFETYSETRDALSNNHVSNFNTGV